ncbi:hypothetical protein [Bacillus sp. Marseille-Q3570]|uniref:hypothetical protein n=1 Tax=Bacillus sp. Marseille-Q3570 TaxID=2963522 RepID=UPI0021B7E720|nr:hypothetical protein [Bacillus sp. Marseille-Q3570]
MALRNLWTEHYIAIEYLVMPDRGGLTLEEIAEKCSVTRKVLYNWRQDDLLIRN